MHYYRLVLFITILLIPTSLLQPIGIGFSWDSESGFSVHPIMQGYGLDRKYAPAWGASVIDAARSSQTITDNNSLDNALFSLSYALRLFLPASELYANQNMGDITKILILGASMLFYYLNEDAGLPIFPLLAKKCGTSTLKIKKMIDRFIQEYDAFPSASLIASDPVFISSMQDLCADVCHITMPVIADSLTQTMTPGQMKSYVSHITEVDIAFMSRLMLPIVLLRAHFGAWMPDMKMYITYNLLQHLKYRLSLGLGRFALRKTGLSKQKTGVQDRELTYSLASVISTNDSSRMSDNIRQSFFRLRGWPIDQYDNFIHYSLSMSRQETAMRIYAEGQKLIFKHESIEAGFIYNHPRYGKQRMRYPDQIDFIEDVWDIIRANKVYLEQHV